MYTYATLNWSHIFVIMQLSIKRNCIYHSCGDYSIAHLATRWTINKIWHIIILSLKKDQESPYIKHKPPCSAAILQRPQGGFSLTQNELLIIYIKTINMLMTELSSRCPMFPRFRRRFAQTDRFHL